METISENEIQKFLRLTMKVLQKFLILGQIRRFDGETFSSDLDNIYQVFEHARLEDHRPEIQKIKKRLNLELELTREFLELGTVIFEMSMAENPLTVNFIKIGAKMLQPQIAADVGIYGTQHNDI